MVETIRQIAADLHSAAESLKAIEAAVQVLTRVTASGFSVIILCLAFVIARR